MPGANCSVYGCSVSRRTKGVSIFRVPRGDDEFNVNWRKKWVDILTRNREVDHDLKRQIDNKNLHICELHFTQDLLIQRM